MAEAYYRSGMSATATFSLFICKYPQNRGYLENVVIVASGGFDEYKIADSVKNGAAIDAYGVGTKMGTSADSPYTDMAYKLVQYNGRPVLKLSTGKKPLWAGNRFSDYRKTVLS